jgi:hypothetical protein
VGEGADGAHDADLPLEVLLLGLREVVIAGILLCSQRLIRSNVWSERRTQKCREGRLQQPPAAARVSGSSKDQGSSLAGGCGIAHLYIDVVNVALQHGFRRVAHAHQRHSVLAAVEEQLW